MNSINNNFVQGTGQQNPITAVLTKKEIEQDLTELQQKESEDKQLQDQKPLFLPQAQLQLEDEQLKKLIAILEKNGLPTKNPVLRIDIIPQNTQYLASQQRTFQLVKTDIENVFKVFGDIKDVQIEAQSGYALVFFNDIVSAFFAQQSLNNFYLSKYNANLQVKWVNNSNSPSQQRQEQFMNQENIHQQPPFYYGNQNYSYNQNNGQQNQQMSQFAYYNVYQQQQQQYQLKQQQQQQHQSQTQSQSQDENIKYTCRFDIQIENDKEFQVARRIIGAKGCNMKRIIEVCCKGQNYDLLKLRLRGKGSGFKEGPRQEESNEPLHLCISSKYFDMYQTACNHVQELILNVYEEYKRFCESNKREPIQDLQIKKVETVTGRRSVPQQPPQTFQPGITQSSTSQMSMPSPAQNQQQQYIQDQRNMTRPSFQFQTGSASTHSQQMKLPPHNFSNYQNTPTFTPNQNQQRNSNIESEQYNQVPSQGPQFQRSHSYTGQDPWKEAQKSWTPQHQQ